MDGDLKRASVPHFPLYHLRHTFATRLSAGGVADNVVIQMLRQGESMTFKRYSQAKFKQQNSILGAVTMNRRKTDTSAEPGTATLIPLPAAVDLIRFEKNHCRK